MKNDSNKLILDICDKISTGHNFGGWTDAMNETYGANDVSQIRLARKVPGMKVKFRQQLQKRIDAFKTKILRRRASAEAKDIRTNPNDKVRG